MRVAVAEILGWRYRTEYAPTLWMKDGMEYFEELPFPDYPRSLDAMHEAEKTLDKLDKETPLKDLVDGFYRIRYGNWLIKLTNMSNPYDATALQRCEAFLRVHGKFVEIEK